MQQLDQAALRVGLETAAARARVALLGGAPHAAAMLEDARSIVSPLPAVWLDRGDEAWSPFRRGVCVGRGDQWAVFRMHLRQFGDDDRPRAAGTVSGRDARGRSIPIAWVDADALTLHWLVDVTRAIVVDASAGCRAETLLAETLALDPLLAIAARCGPPIVGPDVVSAVTTLLMRIGAPAATTPELSALDRMIGLLSSQRSSAGARLAEMRRRLALAMCSPTLTAEARQLGAIEAQRLQRFVASRVVAQIRFGDQEISCVVQPLVLPEMGVVPALRFVLTVPAGGGRGVRLHLAPVSGGRATLVPVCLGEAEGVLAWFAARGDLVGLIDTVLDYLEYNPSHANHALALFHAAARVHGLTWPAALRD